jgi:TPR repeat protein
MLGYCALYGLGDNGNPAISSRDRDLTRSERVELAAAYFEKAAQADHVGALTALGDLYAFGLCTPAAATAEDEALRYYMEAVRLGEAREFLSDAADDSPIDAFMSLAERSMAVAESAAAEGDEGSAELARVRTWRSLAGASEEGSLDAAVSMAACAYHGYGTPQNTDTALWFLDKAARAEEGRVTASLWLGDLYYAGKERESSPALADEAYLRAISLPDTVSECGAYTLRERREARIKQDDAARAEACYRIAALRAIHFAGGEDIRESFPYLVRAVLMGHTAAREDLARMYAFESTYIEATSPKEKKSSSGWSTPAGIYARRRLSRRDNGSATPRDSRAGRSHEGWMTDYYTALWPEPVLFSLGMRATSAPADRPAYVSAEVTPAMLAAALNYLGDCLFYGAGIPEDVAAAASCYREAADMRIPVPRGQSVPAGQIWAQYSYGWCLLHGKGVPEDPRAAVRYLTYAAKTHAEACYALGECYEGGIGVDSADEVEAYKFYRKALKLGYRRAEFKVKALEKYLRDSVTD